MGWLHDEVETLGRIGEKRRIANSLPNEEECKKEGYDYYTVKAIRNWLLKELREESK